MDIMEILEFRGTQWFNLCNDTFTDPVAFPEFSFEKFLEAFGIVVEGNLNDWANAWRAICARNGLDPQKDEGFSFADFLRDNTAHGFNLRYKRTMNPIVPKMLDVNTKYISEETAKWLDEAAGEDSPCVVYRKGQHGWFVPVGNMNVHWDDLPNDLKVVLVYAAGVHDCSWVMFDQDGEEHEALLKFNW